MKFEVNIYMKCKYILSNLLIVGLCSSAAFAAPGAKYSDEWLQGRISGALDYNSALDSSDIEVKADAGVITLSGKVPSLVEKEFAEKLSIATDGVAKVENKLEIDEAMNSVQKTSFRQKVRDATTTAAVKTNLIANKNTHGFSVDVDTTGNTVTLSGNVATEAEKELVERIAYTSPEVREIKNNLVVVSTSRAMMGSGEKTFSSTVSDTWITGRINAMVIFATDFSGSDIQATTRNGLVVLKGFARNPDQKSKIQSSIEEISGVKSVDNQLSVVKR